MQIPSAQLERGFKFPSSKLLWQGSSPLLGTSHSPLPSTPKLTILLMFYLTSLFPFSLQDQNAKTIFGKLRRHTRFFLLWPSAPWRPRFLRTKEQNLSFVVRAETPPSLQHMSNKKQSWFLRADALHNDQTILKRSAWRIQCFLWRQKVWDPGCFT